MSTAVTRAPRRATLRADQPAGRDVAGHLAAGAERFADLRRGGPPMSPTLRSWRLKQLEGEGVLVGPGPSAARCRLGSI